MGVDLVETLVADVLRDLGGMSRADLASQLGIATIVTLGLAETAWLASRRRGAARDTTVREAAAAAGMGIGGMLVGGALAGLFVLGFELVGRLAPEPAAAFWARHPVIGLATAFVAWDLVGYCYHRIGHSTAIGWAAHRPHHTGTDFTLSLAWRQSWLPVHGVVLPLVAIGGWSLSTIVVCAAVSNLLQALQHTSASVRFPGWLVAICMTPIQHRHHHASPTAPGTVNLGPVFTIWDRLAGTYAATPIDADATYGVGVTSSNPLRLQFEGWAELAAGLQRAASSRSTTSSMSARVAVGPPDDRHTNSPISTR